MKIIQIEPGVYINVAAIVAFTYSDGDQTVAKAFRQAEEAKLVVFLPPLGKGIKTRYLVKGQKATALFGDIR